MNTQEKSHVNREYKDRLFKYIFGREEHKEWTLSLYNAINGSDHRNPEDIIFTTIEDAVYLGMKNDVSFLLLDDLIFWEQQSSINPNLPARFLIYVGMSMNMILDRIGHIIYSTKLYKIPTPKCVCFYNGENALEDRTILRLSDAYEGVGDVEVRVMVYNVNYGHNEEILRLCKPLMEYSFFIQAIRNNVKNGMPLIDAITKAVNDFPDDALLKDFLIANKAEVTNMCITEYDEQAVKEFLRKEAYDDGVSDGLNLGIIQGKSEGKIEGKEEVVLELYNEGLIDIKTASEKLGMSKEEFIAKVGQI